MAQALHKDETHSIKDICTSLGISRATRYRSLDAPATPDGQRADR